MIFAFHVTLVTQSDHTMMFMSHSVTLCDLIDGMKGGKSLVILVSRLVRKLPYEAIDGLTAKFPGLVAYVIDEDLTRAKGT